VAFDLPCYFRKSDCFVALNNNMLQADQETFDFLLKPELDILNLKIWSNVIQVTFIPPDIKYLKTFYSVMVKF
jgi:hypothetical protein